MNTTDAMWMSHDPPTRRRPMTYGKAARIRSNPTKDSRPVADRSASAQIPVSRPSIPPVAKQTTSSENVFPVKTNSATAQELAVFDFALTDEALNLESNVERASVAKRKTMSKPATVTTRTTEAAPNGSKSTKATDAELAVFNFPSSGQQLEAVPPAIHRRNASPSVASRAMAANTAHGQLTQSVTKRKPTASRTKVQALLLKGSLPARDSVAAHHIGGETRRPTTEDPSVFDFPPAVQHISLPTRTARRTRSSRNSPVRLLAEKERVSSPDSSTRKRKRGTPVLDTRLGRPSVGKPSMNVENTATSMRTRSGRTSRAPSIEPQKSVESKDDIVRKARPLMAKGRSAPALLQDMLLSSDSKTSDHSSPGCLADSATPQKLLTTNTAAALNEHQAVDRTPVASRRSSPGAGAATPRQRKALRKLLEVTSSLESPGSLGFANLEISEASDFRAPRLARSVTDLPPTRKRVRLVDSLIRTKVPEEESVESDDDSASGSEETGDKPSTQADSQTTLSQTMSQTVLVENAPKRTYARTRSYLVEEDLEAALMQPMMMDISPVKPAGPGLALGGGASSTSSTVPKDKDMELEESAGGMRSIHELRALGGSSKFIDEVNILLDDIANQSKAATASRRTAMMDLTRRLLDQGFAHRFLEFGFDQRLFSQSINILEPVYAFALAAAISFIVEGGATAQTIDRIHRANGVNALASLLVSTRDIKFIAKDRKTNMSRVAQESAMEFRGLLLESSLWTSPHPHTMSPQVVALRALDHLVRKLRENGNTEPLLGADALKDLLSAGNTAMKTVSGGSIPIEGFLVLGILESNSIVSTSDTGHYEALRVFVESLPVLIASAGPLQAEVESLALRLSLNMTNNNPVLCDIFAYPPFIALLAQSINSRFESLRGNLEEDERAATVERLILCLGTMINLAEYSEAARLAILDDGDSTLDGLLQSFRQGQEQASEAESLSASHTNVAYGYLSVLLGNLCQSAPILNIVIGKLSQQGLQALADTVREFIAYHQKVDREMFVGEEGEGVWHGFTARLEKVVLRVEDAILTTSRSI